MDNFDLAKTSARGLVETGVEGGFDALSCSTAGDYPSGGCSQWEGNRLDQLLYLISGDPNNGVPDGSHYAGRAYSDLESSGELDALSKLLDSPNGQEAQINLLAQDTAWYVDKLQTISNLDDTRCMIYALMWCPTSANVVHDFLQHRQDRGFDIRNLETVRDLFRDQYCDAAGVGSQYAVGYANRANTTYDWVSNLSI